MNKSKFFMAAIFPLVFFSCKDFSDLSVPESLSVKSKANYDLSLGGSSFKITDKLDVEKLKDTLEKNNSESSKSKLTVYDFNPTYDPENPIETMEDSQDEVIQYILNYQIEGIDLGLTTDPNLTQIDFDTTFTAPDFSQTIASSLTLNSTLDVAELGVNAAFEPPTPIWFRITSPTFSRMLIRSGTLDITVSDPGNASNDFVMDVTITLTDASGNTLAGPSATTDLSHGGTVSLDLAGKTLVSDMRFVIKGTISGGTPGKSLTYTITAAPSNQLVFNRIEGLTMTAEELGDKATLDINQDFALSGINDALISAKIEEGTLGFSCSYPDGWSGIVVDEEYFVLYGGIQLSNTDFVSSDLPEYILYETANLENKDVYPERVYTYDPNNPSEKSYLKFHLDNATIVFADRSAGEEDEITLTGMCDIKKIDNLVVDISALGQLSGGTENEIDTGISFDSLFSNFLDSEDNEANHLLDNIEFQDIKGYILMTYPEKCSDKIGEISFTGNVTAKYDAGTLPLSDGTFQMKKSDKVLADFISSEQKYDKNGKPVTDDEGELVYNEWIGKDGDTFIKNTNSGELQNTTELLNARPNNLKIAYSLALSSGTSEVTLTGDDIEALSDTSSAINISIALILPFKFVLNDAFDYPSSIRDSTDNVITIDNVLKLAGKELDDDLLKRDSASDEIKGQKYIDLVKSIVLHYNIANDSNLEMTAYFYDDTVFNGTNFPPKPLEIDGDPEPLEFSKEEIQAILSSESYPFIPKIKVAIKESPTNESTGEKEAVILTRGSRFGIDAVVSVQTDGEVEVWNKNKKD